MIGHRIQGHYWSPQFIFLMNQKNRAEDSVPAGRQQLPGSPQHYLQTQQCVRGPQSIGLAPPYEGSV